MVSVDIGEYARTTEDAWRKLREQLKQIVRDVTDDDARLSELQEGIAALRRANADRRSALQGLYDAALEEQQRATSLTLNDTDDEVVLDKETPVTQEEPEQQAAAPSVDDDREEHRRPIPHTPRDPDSGVVLDEAISAGQAEPDEQNPPASAEGVALEAQVEAGDVVKPVRPKATTSKSSRTEKSSADEQTSLLEDVAEEGRQDE